MPVGNFNIDEIKEAIEASTEDSAIYIACDSKEKNKNGKRVVEYTTVCVIHHSRSRGCQVFGKFQTEAHSGRIKEKLLREVELIVDLGLQLIDTIGDRHFEVHVDINSNPKYKSNEVIRQARGWIMGTLNVEPKFKPDACMASNGADLLHRKR